MLRNTPHGIEVDAAPIVATFEYDSSPEPMDIDRHAPGILLARGSPFPHELNSVCHRITDELRERALDHFEDVRIKAYLAALPLEHHLLGKRSRGVARHPLKPGEQGSRRNQPELFRGVAQLT
jgi:hypothetical protein